MLELAVDGHLTTTQHGLAMKEVASSVADVARRATSTTAENVNVKTSSALDDGEVMLHDDRRLSVLLCGESHCRPTSSTLFSAAAQLWKQQCRRDAITYNAAISDAELVAWRCRKNMRTLL